MNELPIIIDTDIGDDIDDALAIVLAMGMPGLDLYGITTVFRDAPLRAVLTTKLLTAFERTDIPVVAGFSRPLQADFDPTVGAQFKLLDDYDRAGVDRTSPPENVVRFIRESAAVAESHDQRLTLVPIGPLTNIAQALIADPSLAARCDIHLMGGCYGKPEIEWNMRCDPEAAAIVLASGANITMIGLDVTRQCMLTFQESLRIGNDVDEGGMFLRELVGLWPHQVTLHDPLAIYSANGEFVTYEPMHIEIDLAGPERGRTRVVDGKPNARVAVAVDDARVIDDFLSLIAS